MVMMVIDCGDDDGGGRDNDDGHGGYDDADDGGDNDDNNDWDYGCDGDDSGVDGGDDDDGDNVIEVMMMIRTNRNRQTTKPATSGSQLACDEDVISSRSLLWDLGVFG